MMIVVINGPNINMLGIREKNIYGAETYEDLKALLEKTFAEKGVEGEIYQSNHEGDLVDRIQQAYFDGTEGIVINPAAGKHNQYIEKTQEQYHQGAEQTVFFGSDMSHVVSGESG